MMNILQTYFGVVLAIISVNGVVYNSTDASYNDILGEEALIKIYPEEPTVNAPSSNSFVLSCVALNDGLNGEIIFMEWKDPNGTIIQEQSNFKSEGARKLRNNTLRLVFSLPLVRDSGKYTCSAVYSNNATLKATITVNFYDDIKFEDCSEEQSLALGRSGEIKCTITGKPFPEVYWLKDDLPMPTYWRYSVLLGQVLVPMVTRDVEGLYTVEAFVLTTGQFKKRTINVTVQAAPCSFYEFHCRNGRCVNRNHFCDGVNDCGDWSDELNCPSSTPRITSSCSSREFTCDNGRCVRFVDVCDGHNDCGDWSDERNCHLIRTTSTPCLRFQFRCNNGRCIDYYYVCDRNNDCGDWSDELNCLSTTTPRTTPKQCSNREFLCDNGRCINRNYVCDGDNDCGDWSDERNCNPSKRPGCLPGMFTCRNRRCILPRDVCDGDNDCGDFSDEADCKQVATHMSGMSRGPFGAIIGVTAGISVLVLLFILTIWCMKIRKQKMKSGTPVNAQPKSVDQSGQHFPERLHAPETDIENSGSSERVPVQVLPQPPVSGNVTQHYTNPYPSPELHQAPTSSEVTQRHENVHSTILPDRPHAPPQDIQQIPQSNLYPTLPQQAYPTAPESPSE